MSQTAPRPAAKLIALLSSLAVAAVVAVALWSYLGGGGDDPATRRAVVGPVEEAVNALRANAERCAEGFAGLAADGAATAAQIDAFRNCGAEARRLAEAGYATLDAATGPDDSPLRAEFLDSAGALMSVHEIQGDDFDVIHELLKGARAGGRPATALAGDIGYMLGNVAPDIAAAEMQFTRTLDAYRAGG